MSYNDVRAMVKDHALVERIAACAATQPGIASPLDWAWANVWHLASSPGWDASWDYAEAVPVPNIGADEGVITDAMILSAVQARLGA